MENRYISLILNFSLLASEEDQKLNYKLSWLIDCIKVNGLLIT